jgi:hypothetical protein
MRRHCGTCSSRRSRARTAGCTAGQADLLSCMPRQGVLWALSKGRAWHCGARLTILRRSGSRMGNGISSILAKQIATDPQLRVTRVARGSRRGWPQPQHQQHQQLQPGRRDNVRALVAAAVLWRPPHTHAQRRPASPPQAARRHTATVATRASWRPTIAPPSKSVCIKVA